MGNKIIFKDTNEKAPSIIDAIVEVHGDSGWSMPDGVNIVWIDEETLEVLETPVVTQTVLEDKLTELQARWDAGAYKRERAQLYAEKTYGEQIEMMSDDARNGTTTHRDWEDSIKATVPKPTET